MLILPSTTDSLDIVLGTAQTTNPMRVVSSYRDITTTAFTPGRRVVNTNGVTQVQAVTPPAASTSRVIDFVSVFNSDTVAKLVTIALNDNGTRYTIISVTLGVGERIEYQEGQGWRVFTNTGSLKQTTLQGTNQIVSGLQVGILAADVTNNNAVANTIADVTGLSFAVVNGRRYWFRFVIHYTAAAGATGSRWSINGPTITRLAYRSSYSLTTASETVNSGLNAYNLPAASNATTPSTTGNTAIIEGHIQPSADGNVIARFASEVASSAIVAKAGSIVEYMDVT